jgi:hypothetical protein
METMRNVYRVLAYLVAAGVALQAAAIAYGMFGLFKWIEQGGTIDQSTRPTPAIGGYTGLIVHGIGGIVIVPAIALLFLIISFFARIPGGIRWALIVFGTTALQVTLGLFAHSVAGLGWLHGFNALIVFAAAVMAGMRATRVVKTAVDTAPAESMATVA